MNIDTRLALFCIALLAVATYALAAGEKNNDSASRENATAAVATLTATSVGEITPTVAEAHAPKEPGIEAVFAIAGLLAVAYLVLRQKRK